MKKIALFFILALVVIATQIVLSLDKREMFIPYPYQCTYPLSIPSAIKESTILFVGDQIAKSFSLFNKDLLTEIFEHQDSPFKIYNWAENGEGLHRTIYKLKQLKHYPPLVIYSGGTQEFYERKFYIKDRKKIIKNFHIFDNPTYQSMLMLFPALSKILYTPTTTIQMSSSIQKQQLDFVQSQQFIFFNEILFTLYQHELAELFQLAHDKKFKLLVIIPPLNIDLPIVNNCLSTLGHVKKRQQEIRQLLNQHNFLEAHTKAIILYNDDPTNGLNAQLLAKALLGLNKVPEAIRYLEKATNYDCDLNRGNSVLNAILLKQLQTYGIPYSNFNKYLLNFYGKNLLFFDAVLPQRYYYNKYIVKLAKQIREMLNL